MGQPLDNPVWSSLTSLHRGLARSADGAMRYPRDVAPFLGIADEGPVSPAAAADLIEPSETVFLVGPRPEAPPGWRVEALGPLAQMICEAPVPAVDGPPILPLTADHRPLVLELTALVYPHYFRPRTMELGRYFGIFEGPRLAAMIGERMGMPGFREVSAVCTHPDFLGRGLARRLLVWLSNDLHARGEVPFLHVSPSNERATVLYERNGYRTRGQPAFWSLGKVGAPGGIER